MQTWQSPSTIYCNSIVDFFLQYVLQYILNFTIHTYCNTLQYIAILLLTANIVAKNIKHDA
jgi:protein gp37